MFAAQRCHAAGIANRNVFSGRRSLGSGVATNDAEGVRTLINDRPSLIATGVRPVTRTWKVLIDREPANDYAAKAGQR